MLANFALGFLLGLAAMPFVRWLIRLFNETMTEPLDDPHGDISHGDWPAVPHDGSRALILNNVTTNEERN